MSPAEYNQHQSQFCAYTYEKEKEAYDLAIAEAKQKKEQGIEPGKIFRVSRRICNDAYELFKKNMQTAYPDDQDKNLLALTLMSRDKKFFYELPEKVREILKGTQPELNSETPSCYPPTATNLSLPPPSSDN